MCMHMHMHMCTCARTFSSSLARRFSSFSTRLASFFPSLELARTCSELGWGVGLGSRVGLG